MEDPRQQFGGSEETKISVAMATFNGERYLQEQLESLNAQTRTPDELVVCDDCSTDRTIQVLKAFRKNAPFPVRVYQNATNQGYSQNFERAISLCKGDILFVCDQDDVWFPEKLATVVALFESEHPSLVVFNDAEITNESLEPSGLSVIGQLYAAGFSPQTFVMGCCTAFRAELRSLVMPIPHHMPYDCWIHQIGLLVGGRIYLAQVLQYYRRHGENASGWFTNTVKPVTLLDRFLYSARGDVQAACVRRLAHLDEVLGRLVDRGDKAQELLQGDMALAKALDNVQREQAAVMRRLALLQRGRFSRLPEGLRMLRNDDYRYFSGWISFIKDLLF